MRPLDVAHESWESSSRSTESCVPHTVNKGEAGEDDRCGTDQVNYSIDMNDIRKRHCVFHINMLKKWHVQPETAFPVQIFPKWTRRMKSKLETARKQSQRICQKSMEI